MLQLEDNMTYEFTVTDFENIAKAGEKGKRARKKEDVQRAKFLRRVGRKGEIAFSKIFKNQIKFGEFISKQDGCDFILDDNTRIDVKTLDADYQSKVYIDIDDYHKSDLFVVMRATETGASYLRSLKSTEAYKNLKYDKKNDCYFVDLFLFESK